MNDIAQTKDALRQRILSDRINLNLSKDADFTETLSAVTNLVNPSRIAIFKSYPTEPNTKFFIESVKLPVLVPLSHPDGTLTWIDSESELATKIQSDDLLFIPALAIDHEGNRLGRGKGYFDRELAKIPKSVLVYAVIFEREFLNTVPTEAHDRKVNGVVTEVSSYKIN